MTARTPASSTTMGHGQEEGYKRSHKRTDVRRSPYWQGGNRFRHEGWEETPTTPARTPSAHTRHQRPEAMSRAVLGRVVALALVGLASWVAGAILYVTVSVALMRRSE